MSEPTAVGTGRACRDCGRRWYVRDARRYTALGLRLRRAARHAGVNRRWAHPRPDDRCPSCASRAVTSTTTLPPQRSRPDAIRPVQ